MKIIEKRVKINKNMIKKAQECLADNGIDRDETATVLQALGYILLDSELEDLLDWDEDAIDSNKVTEIVTLTDERNYLQNLLEAAEEADQDLEDIISDRINEIYERIDELERSEK